MTRRLTPSGSPCPMSFFTSSPHRPRLSCLHRPRSHLRILSMNRRDFLTTSAASSLALSGLYAAEPATKPLRVGLIGAGWYGKCSLFRLLQVAPVEVVALCDPCGKMLAEAVQMVGDRTGGKAKPKTFSDYREMLKAEPFDIVQVETPDHWHALPMIAACEA